MIKHRSGEMYPAHLLSVTKQDIQSRESDPHWEQSLDWKIYLTKGYDTRKLLVISSHVIQGLIALQVKENWVQVELVESAPVNRGRHKEFVDVGSVLFAYACKRSFDLGFDGVISFRAKTALFKHYITVLGAQIINVYQGSMVIDTVASKRLVELYWS